ncbi:MAG: septum formation initiator family protein [Muribaculaceae bacterium]|nr:septum formation initiator family protein [Muribaculaceae bacterium]MBR3100393.1 septum formation initiator family protein [Muribaculaceae bacterium]
MFPFDNIHRPKWIPRWLNLPFVVFIVFVVLLLFTGENNYLKINSLKKQINELKAEIKANEDSAAVYDAKVQELNTDRESLEKIAREKYGMKRVNEDVYITDIQ